MTIGFFSGRTAQQKRENPKKDLCEICKLNQRCKTPKMAASGHGECSALIIGEAPGATEDERGVQFVGEAGQLFQEYLRPYGLDLHRDFWLINAVNCRPPSNRTPTLKEIQCCKPNVQAVINEHRPQFIWLVGETAIRSMYSGRFSELGVGRWHRLAIPDKQTNAFIIPMYHPSFALRSGKDQNKLIQFKKDVEFAVRTLKRKSRPVFRDSNDHITLLTDYDEVIKFLQKILDHPDEIAFDFETSNIKPMCSDDQCIYSCAIYYKGKSYAFPVSYTDYFDGDQQYFIKQYLKDILANPKIKKIAHNLQFEDLWSQCILKTKVNNWHFCTMNAAHILDCRKYYSGLKYQSYINFGIEGYEHESTVYMRRTHKNSARNMLDTMPLDKLLRYNAIDALATYWLYKKQKPKLAHDSRANAYELITHPGLQALSDATVYGIQMDRGYYDEISKKIEQKMNSLKERILGGDVAKNFIKLTGRQLKLIDKNFSNADLRIIIYTILGAKSTKETATGLQSVDKSVIESIDHPWAKMLLRWRKQNKILNTYLAQFTKEIAVDDRMHPFFPLHTTRTYRGSSNNPNFQNIPNRDDESRKITRMGIIPSPGRRILAIDYGSQEVRVAAILSQDKKLMWYCMKPKSDMHMDVSSRIWAANPELISGGLRFHAKSGFVFSEIYGSYYLNCAKTLWDKCLSMKLKNDVPLHEHLRDVGIINGSEMAKTKLKIKGTLTTVTKHFAQFVEHIKGIETWFWKEFSGLKAWQEKMIRMYQTYGFVEMPFGFKRSDLLNNNKIFNTAIQGTAFHLLLWSYSQIHRHCEKRWKTKLLGQIHDEILFDLEPEELQEVIDTAEDIMTKKISMRHKWVNVPLAIEPEVTEINQSWYYKKELKRGKDGLWN